LNELKTVHDGFGHIEKRKLPKARGTVDCLAQFGPVLRQNRLDNLKPR
jgi:hypothetical protein